MQMIDLKSFIADLKPIEFGELRRIYEPSIAIMKAERLKRPALFNIRGSVLRSVSSVVSDRKHILKALGSKDEKEAYRKLLSSMSTKNKLRLEGFPGSKEIERNLYKLPAIKFYEKDGGLYFTSSLVISCLDNVCNASIHRILVRSREEGVIRIVPRHLWSMYKTSIKRGEDLPVSIVFGVHPAFLIAAATSPAYGVFELSMVPEILGTDVRLVESPLHKNPVPWPFSALIEAKISKETAPEGPFVDITKTYDRVREQPIIKVLKIYINEDEPFHVILPGGREHALLMGFPREAFIWDSVSKVVPKVHKVRLTWGGGGWLHAIISIEKNHEGDSKNAIIAAFAAHPSLKHVVVVDSDIDVDDLEDVEWAIATRFQGDKDLIIIKNVRGSTLDPSSIDALTTKIGIDATAPLKERERFQKARIPEVQGE